MEGIRSAWDGVVLPRSVGFVRTERATRARALAPALRLFGACVGRDTRLEGCTHGMLVRGAHW